MNLTKDDIYESQVNFDYFETPDEIALLVYKDACKRLNKVSTSNIVFDPTAGLGIGSKYFIIDSSEIVSNIILNEFNYLMYNQLKKIKSKHPISITNNDFIEEIDVENEYKNVNVIIMNPPFSQRGLSKKNMFFYVPFVLNALNVLKLSKSREPKLMYCILPNRYFTQRRYGVDAKPLSVVYLDLPSEIKEQYSITDDTFKDASILFLEDCSSKFKKIDSNGIKKNIQVKCGVYLFQLPKQDCVSKLVPYNCISKALFFTEQFQKDIQHQ
jgi:predicted RNA methylase